MTLLRSSFRFPRAHAWPARARVLRTLAPLAAAAGARVLLKPQAAAARRAACGAARPPDPQPPPQAPQVVFSGIQPTGGGRLHVGNLLGALRPWTHLLAAPCPARDARHPPPPPPPPAAAVAAGPFFALVDLHAMTSPRFFAAAAASAGAGADNDNDNDTRPPLGSAAASDAVREAAALVIASGVDPARCVLYRQSDVREHLELAWILACTTPLAWVRHMRQWREKARDGAPSASLGLFSYPVLMAADILLFRATAVPVGEDQRQHLELANRIARAFNAVCGSAPVFPARIEPLLAPAGARVMSLRDGMRKMSKSDPDGRGRIALADPPDVVAQKIRAAKTDSVCGFPLESLAHRPEARNLLTLFAALAHEPLEDVCARFERASAAEFKEKLIELVVETVCPIGARAAKILRHPRELDAVLVRGAEAARAVASRNLAEVRRVAGLM